MKRDYFAPMVGVFIGLYALELPPTEFPTDLSEAILIGVGPAVWLACLWASGRRSEVMESVLGDLIWAGVVLAVTWFLWDGFRRATSLMKEDREASTQAESVERKLQDLHRRVGQIEVRLVRR